MSNLCELAQVAATMEMTMMRTFRAIAAMLLICAGSAFAQQSAIGGGGPQSANILVTAKDQVDRQQTQPGNNAPVWRAVRSGAEHTTNLPGREMGVLIQTGGEDWRQLRPSIYSIGGGVIAAVLAVLMAVYAIRGPVRLHESPTGRYIRRFSTLERIAHWSMGLSFVVLALTGLVITFGKYIILPVFGYTVFGWIASIAKNLHNFVGPVFSVSLPVFIVIYVRDNFPAAGDLKWLTSLGGLLSPKSEHPPAGRYNAGEKVYFWLVVCAVSVVLAVTGLILDFPNFDQTRSQMQLASTIHMIAALAGTAMACFHIYLGTVGHKGAYEGMRYGYVDETWAKEHHGLWYEDVKAGKAREKFADPSEEVPEPVRTASQN
jgi:formate dehydrogenase subunit gamma